MSKVDKPTQLVLDLFTKLDEFGHIARAVNMSSGVPESNTHHSYILALVGYEFARQYAPELNANLILRYALVHDLAELITGDMRTLTASEDELEKKKIDDQRATKELILQLHYSPHIMKDLEAYENLNDDESRYVYWLDKCMTIPTHFFDEGDNLKYLGVKTQAQIQQWRTRTLKKLHANAPHPHPSVEKLFEDLYIKMHDELLKAE